MLLHSWLVSYLQKGTQSEKFIQVPTSAITGPDKRVTSDKESNFLFQDYWLLHFLQFGGWKILKMLPER